MPVITALSSTRNLGQKVNIALTKADTARGLIATMADRLIGAWSRTAELGLDQLGPAAS